jgi:hypothetical protein
MGDVGALADPPYALTDNAESLMAVSDLVFVDPVSTGYSRVVAGSTPEPFHGYQGDVESVGQLIRIWTRRNKRWLTPKFVEGPGRLRHPLLPTRTRRVCTPAPPPSVGVACGRTVGGGKWARGCGLAGVGCGG